MKQTILFTMFWLIFISSTVIAQPWGGHHANHGNPHHMPTQYGSDLIIHVPSHEVTMLRINGRLHDSDSPVIVLQNLNPGVYEVHLYRMTRVHPFAPATWIFAGGSNINVPPASRVEANWNSNVGFLVRADPLYQPVVQQRHRGNRRGGNRNQGHYREPDPIGMHAEVFFSLKSRLSNTSFESTRLEIAKVAIRNHGISTRQLMEIMPGFYFDNSRLDLAKYAYHYTDDPQNYFMMHEVFTFDSNARALLAYTN